MSCFFKGEDVLFNILTGAFINIHFIFYGENNVLGNLAMYLQALNILVCVFIAQVGSNHIINSCLTDNSHAY